MAAAALLLSPPLECVVRGIVARSASLRHCRLLLFGFFFFFFLPFRRRDRSNGSPAVGATRGQTRLRRNPTAAAGRYIGTPALFSPHCVTEHSSVRTHPRDLSRSSSKQRYCRCCPREFSRRISFLLFIGAGAARPFSNRHHPPSPLDQPPRCVSRVAPFWPCCRSVCTLPSCPADRTTSSTTVPRRVPPVPTTVTTPWWCA